MLYIKQRFFAFAVALIGFVFLWHSHYDAQHNGSYNLKEAALTPVAIVAGTFLVFFPQYFGRPQTSREKLVVFGVLTVGIIISLYNWHLIDPYNFRFLDHLAK